MRSWEKTDSAGLDPSPGKGQGAAGVPSHIKNIIEWNRGLKLTGASFWLDGSVPVDLSLISRPSSLLNVRHKRIVTTRPCSLYVRKSEGPKSTLAAGFHQPLRLGRLEVTLLPSGYGASTAQAQIRTERGANILYFSGFCPEQPEGANHPPFCPGVGDVMVINLDNPIVDNRPCCGAYFKTVGAHTPQQDDQLAPDQEREHLLRPALSRLVKRRGLAVVLLEPWMLPEVMGRLGGWPGPVLLHRSLHKLREVLVHSGESGLDDTEVTTQLLRRPIPAESTILWPAHLNRSDALRTLHRQYRPGFIQLLDQGGLHLQHHHSGGHLLPQPGEENRAGAAAIVSPLDEGAGSDPLDVSKLQFVYPVLKKDLLDYIQHVNPHQVILGGSAAPSIASLLGGESPSVQVVNDRSQLNLFHGRPSGS